MSILHCLRSKLSSKHYTTIVLMLMWILTLICIINKSKKHFEGKTIFAASENQSYCRANTLQSDCCSPSYWDTMLDSASLTSSQLMQYFLWTNRSSCKLAHDIGGVMQKNPSGMAGQKTVCIDPQVAPIPNQCLVYSFGIDDEWSFDEQMELYGCEVFAFDPSMGKDHHDHSPGIHFYNWGLGNSDEYDSRYNWTLRSFSSIYETLSIRHGPKIIDYLKIDIEYSEWVALPQIIESGMLSKVRQLGIEIHLEYNMPMEKHRKWSKLLRSIEETGMIRFDSKYNPWSFGNFIKNGKKIQAWGPLGFEIAWYNSKLLHAISV